MNGVVVVDKPSGRTSRDCVEEVKRSLGIKKAGHTGTLDPLATGVLPICVGEATKLVQFLALSPRAQAYREGLEAKRVNARVHLRKILALAELHGKEAVARALDDGLELQAFSAEYIANILAARRRIGPEPAALQLTRRADLLDLELPEPDLSIYDRDEGADDESTP